MRWWGAAVEGSREVVFPTREGVPRNGAGPAAGEARLDRVGGFGVGGIFERECCLKEGGRSLLPMSGGMWCPAACVHDMASSRATGRGSWRCREGSREPGREVVRDYARVIFVGERGARKMVTGEPGLWLGYSPDGPARCFGTPPV